MKRFPEKFCFQLSVDECSRFQIGILNGGRGSNLKYLPYVYTEQGVAMLTSALRTDRAIEASIHIMEAFVEMAHVLRQNLQLLPYEEIRSLETKHYKLAERVQTIEDNMVAKAELSDMMKLFEADVSTEEILILNGEPFKADVAYQKIYARAKKRIIVVDDYIGVKTLKHLAKAKDSIEITLISDNKGHTPLRLSEYNDFLVEYPNKQVSFIKNSRKAHDRYIVIDYGTKGMRIYFCGASSKDAGKRIMTIAELKGTEEFVKVIEGLLGNPVLILK